MQRRTMTSEKYNCAIKKTFYEFKLFKFFINAAKTKSVPMNSPTENLIKNKLQLSNRNKKE